MTSYQIITIPNFKEKGLKKITPQTKDDLPEEIKGQATWRSSAASLTGKAIPPSYYIQKEEQVYYPIELINQNWYFIEWDDNESYYGYWVRFEDAIPQGKYGLGWPGNPAEAKTPVAGSSMFRERAESGSTQPEPISGAESDQSSDADPMDNNPATTEQLASMFEANPVFADIAEELQEQGDRQHYLPTTIGNPLKPTGINPRTIRARATRERETIF